MPSYPAAGRSASVFADEGDLPAGVMVAVPLRCLVSPVKGGAPVQDGDRSALVVGGTEKIRAGEPVVFLKVVAAAEAVVARKGQVRAEGSPCGHATLGALEDWLDSQAGPGVIGGIADRAVLDCEVRQGRAGTAAGRRVHDPGDRAADADAGSAARRRDHRAGRGPGPGALVEAVAAGVGAGLPGLAQGARPGAAGGTAGRRAGGGRGKSTGTGAGSP